MIACIVFLGFVVAITWASVVVIEWIGSRSRKKEETDAIAPVPRSPWPELGTVRFAWGASKNIIRYRIERLSGEQIALRRLPLARSVAPARCLAMLTTRRSAYDRRGVRQTVFRVARTPEWRAALPRPAPTLTARS